MKSLQNLGENTKTTILKKLWNIFFVFLFPPHCLICKKEGADFCTSCRKKIPVLGKFNSDGIFSLWEYGHPSVHKVLIFLKYKNKKTLAHPLAESLSDTVLECLAEKSLFDNPYAVQKYILIPIPLSKKRFMERGYNQAELLAQELFQQNSQSFTLEKNVLYKIKDTKSQVSTKNRTERLKNLRGSFAVKNKETIQGKIILLIDDITTTGATIEEARRVLLNNGARLVYGITVAH
jgi:ComF family protein